MMFAPYQTISVTVARGPPDLTVNSAQGRTPTDIGLGAL